MYPNLPLISWTLSLLTGELGGGGGRVGKGRGGGRGYNEFDRQ